MDFGELAVSDRIILYCSSDVTTSPSMIEGVYEVTGLEKIPDDLCSKALEEERCSKAEIEMERAVPRIARLRRIYTPIRPLRYKDIKALVTDGVLSEAMGNAGMLGFNLTKVAESDLNYILSRDEVPATPTIELRIDALALTNYKTYQDVNVKLDGYNIIIGANASGKTNLVSSLKMIRDIAQNSIDDGISLNAGFSNIFDAGSERIRIEFQVDEELPIFLRGKNLGIMLMTLGGRMVYELENGKERGRQERVRFIIESKHRRRHGIARMRNSALPDLDLEAIITKLESCLDEIAMELVDGRIELTLISHEYQATLSEMIKTLEAKGNEIATFSDQGLRLDRMKKDEESMDLLRFLRYVSFGKFTKLERIKIFDFEPKKMKQIQGYTVDNRLYEDGSNLSLVLNALSKDDEKKSRFIKKMKRLIPAFDDFRLETIPHTSSQLLVVKEKYESGKSNEIGSTGISDGTTVMMGLVYALFFDDAQVMILEEPERSVHPALISEMMALIKEASKQRQIIVTTHNPEFLRWADMDRIRLVYRSEDGHSHVVNPMDLPNVQFLLKKEIGIEYIFVNNGFGV